MERPVKYEQLVHSRALAIRPSLPGEVQTLLRNAKAYLRASRRLYMLADPHTASLSAYKGIFHIIHAFLTLYELQVTEDIENIIVIFVCQDLGMTGAEQSMVSEAHRHFRDSPFQSPFPQASLTQAQALVEILAAYLPDAYRIAAIPYTEI